MVKFSLKFPVFDFSLTFNIIETLIIQSESSIEKAIAEYKEKGPEEYVIDISPEEGLYQSIDYYMGLDSSSVDLDDMFLEYYPSVFRRSVFLTIFGMFEHEIEKFCNNFARKHQTPINISDLKGSGFERSHLFIKKLLGMKTSPHYSTIRKITKLRNSCAHNDAKYIENDGQNSTLIFELMNAHPDLFKKDGKQVLFMNGALTMVLDSFKSYLAEVEQALDEYEKWIRSGDKVAAVVGTTP
ncbi:hypothetical protein WIC93_06435 [Enterobacter cloacae]|nr:MULTISPECIES: hypothetical protein [Enterobacter]EKM5717656.1 hypothetical protein [Enterobacter cloacae]EKP1127831.1 hypothetical protein [Enterobacter cloacae]EKU2771735.1 hypothetical protein [Enterobacter cloacae]EKV7706166.1 hypothetical protein [Enterobacter cloacae]ELK7547841.1 hypothetical protein [Enterobacter cloacae]